MKTEKKFWLFVLGLLVAGVAYAGVIVHGQLIDASAENLSSDPTSHTGRVYFNTTGNHAKLYNSAAWEWLAPNPLTTAGDIIYGSSTATPAALSRLAIGAATTVLHGGASAPAYSAVVSADFSGTLTVAKGGTGGDLSGATGVLYDAAGTISSITIDTAWTTYTPTITGCTNNSNNGVVTSARYIHTNPKMVRFEVIVSCTGAASLFSISIPVTADYAGASQVLVGNVSSSYAGAAVGYLPFIVSGDMTHVYVTNTSATQTRLNASAFTTTTSTVTLFFDVAI